MGGFDLIGIAYLVVVLALLFFPLLVSRGSSPGDDEEEHDDGPGGPPRQPPPTPSGPSDRIPMPDAQPSRVRLRDHGRIADARPTRARRPTPHPAPARRPRV